MNSLEVRNFGFNLILKDFAKISCFLPLPCHLEHGWTPLAEPLVTDLETHKPLMLVLSKRRKEAWEKRSKIPVEIMGAPFIHYKNMKKVHLSSRAKGTIVFPNHSMPGFEVKFSVENYCKELKKLPQEFHPITVCLFWFDFIDDRADIYRKMGFRVVTAGPKLTNDLSFVKNFYKLLSSHKYATSNDIGSYTFYSVNLGVPFFLLGEIPTIINQRGKDRNVPEVTKNDDFYWGKKAIEIFSTGPTTKITTEQKKFVDEEMGVKDCLSREEMHKLLLNYGGKNRYWLKTVFPYIVQSLIAVLIFNGPWIKYLVSMKYNKSKKD